MAARTAWRICQANRWWSVFGKSRRGKNGRPGPPVHDDHVQRVFVADAPNRLWLSDITEHRTDEGKLYLCAVKDVFSNRIVGYTDRGSQFRSCRYTLTLKQFDMIGSMGRVGAAGDNAAMESFFSLLQRNVLDRRQWRTRDELRIAIVTWIERTYHRRRRQTRLGRLTPIEYETIMAPAARQAA